MEFIRGEGMGGGVGGMVYSIKHTQVSGLPPQTSIICSHANHRGDIIARSDSTGSLTSYALYEAYGTRPYEWGTDPDRQKANTKEEETDLNLLNEGMRYRDLATGTFLTRDPIGFADGPNVYCYVHCNPITKFDAFGLSEDDVNEAAKKVQEADKAHREAVEKRTEATGKAEVALDDFQKSSKAYRVDDSEENKKAYDKAITAYNEAEKAYDSAAKTAREARLTYKKSVASLNVSVADYINSNGGGVSKSGIALLTASIIAGTGKDMYQGTHGRWLASNFKFYSNNFNGNQYVGGRIKFGGKMARRFGRAGNVFSGVSVTLAAGDTFNAAMEGDTDVMVKSGAETVAGAIGFIPNPVARVFSASYALGGILDDVTGASDYWGEVLSPRGD